MGGVRIGAREGGVEARTKMAKAGRPKPTVRALAALDPEEPIELALAEATTSTTFYQRFMDGTSSGRDFIKMSNRL